MIYVKIQGRTGNALFQYAFAYSSARRLKTGFCVSSLRALEWFDLDGGSVLSNAVRKSAFKLHGHLKKPFECNWLEYNNCRYTAPETILAGLRGHAVYRGYFQSSDYFAFCADDIKRLFKIKKPLEKSFLANHQELRDGKKLLVIHLRGTDVKGWSVDGEMVMLNPAYYARCLEKISDIGAYRTVAVTDDALWAREMLPKGLPVEYVSSSALKDFLLMRSADVLIMANSTFSWWAGYLNPNPAARIMGPKYWYGHKTGVEAPSGIMHPEWEWI